MRLRSYRAGGGVSSHSSGLARHVKRVAMIDTHALLAIAAIYTLGVTSPGPNFLVIAQRALTRGRAEAFAAMAGVVSVSAIWAGASLFGLAILFRLFPWIHLVLRLVGGAYLIWFGIRLWRAAQRPTDEAPAGPPTRRGLLAAYRAGLATNLSNAKAIAFYTSAFAAVAPAPGQTATLWAALVLVLCLALAWYGLVVLLLSAGPLARAYRKGRAWIERVCGAAMILFGLRLAVDR